MAMVCGLRMHVPNTLNEQMAMHQVVSNPLDNAIDMSQLNKHPIILTAKMVCFRWMG